VWVLYVLLNVNPWYLVVSLVPNELKPIVLLVESHLQSLAASLINFVCFCLVTHELGTNTACVSGIAILGQELDSY
jgi:hypothetical protein